VHTGAVDDAIKWEDRTAYVAEPSWDLIDRTEVEYLSPVAFPLKEALGFR
jgi:hypothetical protein